MSAVAPAPPGPFLFGRTTDLVVFGGSAVLAVVLVLTTRGLGISGETPPGLFLLLVVGVDVAHVWSTVFRTYLDPAELRSRPALYLLAPLGCYVAGVLAYHASPLTFWRLLAYLALWHFVRQQVGWMALYGRRERASPRTRRLDAAALYAATLGPALWWHANLPRPYAWFLEGDFVPGLPRWVGTLALAVHAVILLAWAGTQLRHFHPGKATLVLATWVTWFGGIVLARDDVTFTVMNVLLHGLPYTVLLHRYAKRRAAEGIHGGFRLALRAGLPGFALLLAAVAYGEEALWDRLVWNEHASLFGRSGFTLAEDLLTLVVPLLALPQATHYVLDAFIWRAGRDGRLRSRLGWGPP